MICSYIFTFYTYICYYDYYKSFTLLLAESFIACASGLSQKPFCISSVIDKHQNNILSLQHVCMNKKTAFSGTVEPGSYC